MSRIKFKHYVGVLLLALALPLVYAQALRWTQLQGSLPDSKVAANSIGGTKITDGTLTLPKISTSGAADGKVLKFSSGALNWGDDAGSGGGLPPPIGFSFTANGSGYYVADQNYSLTVANESGTGTVAYEVDTGSGFASDPLPITLSPGNTLKVTVSGISGFKAVTLE